MFICYIKMDEENTVPVICDEMIKSDILKDYFLLKGTKLVNDGILPVLEVKELCIKAEQILYYVKGDLPEEHKDMFTKKEEEEESVSDTIPEPKPEKKQQPEERPKTIKRKRKIK